MAIQLIEDYSQAEDNSIKTVFPHYDDEIIDEAEKDNDSVNEEAIPGDVLMVPRPSIKYLGKSVGDMISPDTYVTKDGYVLGTLKKVENFVEFNTANVAEQSGYYFPFILGQSGKKMTFLKDGTPTKTDIPYDPEILFRIPNKDTTFEVQVDGKSVIKLDFTKTTFEDTVG